MLYQFLNVRTFAPSFLRHVYEKPAHTSAPATSEEQGQLPLKIMHAGGVVENYYMAIPAIRIMEKYPSFLLARPDIFRRPWDSLVRSEEILTPGQKFFVVPRRTVQKLRRRIQRHDGEPSTHSSKRRSEGISISSGSVSQDEFFIESGSSKASNVSFSFFESSTSSSKASRRGKKGRKAVMWHPTLTVIGEGPSARGADD